MKRAILLAPFLAIVVLISVWPGESWAIPAFARKYGVNCTMCHSAFPRLNDFGTRYRDNGYRLPGRENDERTVLQGPAPIALRTSAGYDYESFKNTPDAEDVSQLRLGGLDLLSGGLLGRNIGYFVIYTPQITASRGVAGQEGALEMANVVFPRLKTGWLNVRAGRFEPAFVAFSVKRHLSFSPYEIYDYTFPGGAAFSETQTGIEVFGHGARGIHYAVGILDGADSGPEGVNPADDSPGDLNLADDSPADVYARASMVFGAGEGQTAGHRVGVVGYRGKSRYWIYDTATDPPTLLRRSDRKSYSRYGVDASLNFAQVNVALQYLWGTDDGGFWGATSDADFSGGFAEVSYQPLTRLVGFARYDRICTPDAAEEDRVSRYTVGGRYYLTDQIALHGEYSRRAIGFRAAGEDDATDRSFTARLDFAF